jgi:hypothetical protein
VPVPSDRVVAPRWIRLRPFLYATVLRWVNIHRRYRFLLPVITALFALAGALMAVPAVGHALEAVARYPVVPLVSLGSLCAVLTARRRASVRQSASESWLAPLRAPSSTFIRMILPPVALLLLLELAVAIAFLAGKLSGDAAVTLWATIAAAFVGGSIVGWLSQGSSPASVPGFHYVTVRAPRESWARAPRLSPLSYWAVGQAKVITKPKVAAKTLLVVLLAIPMETTPNGQKAIAIAAGAYVSLYIVALFVAMVDVAFKAARWLATTKIRYAQFTLILGYRVLLSLIWVWAGVLFLVYAAEGPSVWPWALMSIVLLCVVNGVASWLAMK